MSMLDTMADIMSVFFPPVCPICRTPLADNEHFVCTACRFQAPLTGFSGSAYNPMVRHLEGLIPVHRATAFMWFIEGSPWQRLIHSFKYRGFWITAYEFGEWFGYELADSGLYSDVDLVIPVPLHWFKRLRRGYNQSEYIAHGIANRLGAVLDDRSVLRRVNNRSQARSGSAQDRWENAEGIFAVRNPEALAGKHILLVDDVFTTGATMISCATSIIRSLGADNVKVSIAALAVTQRGMAIDR